MAYFNFSIKNAKERVAWWFSVGVLVKNPVAYELRILLC